MRLGRRRFLGGLAAAVAAAAATATGLRRWTGGRHPPIDRAEPDPAGVAARLAEILVPPGRVAGLGASVLASGGVPADVHLLASEVVAAVPELADGGDLRRALRRTVRAELGRGEWVDAAGWLLAPTEARAAALLALLDAP